MGLAIAEKFGPLAKHSAKLLTRRIFGICDDTDPETASDFAYRKPAASLPLDDIWLDGQNCSGGHVTLPCSRNKDLLPSWTVAIEPDGVAPYAPPTAVLAVVDFDRRKGLPTPVTLDTIVKVGITESLSPRTLQALRSLDLVDQDGMPTEAMVGLRKASTEEFPTRLADVVRSAYAEVFRYCTPGEDDVERIRDQFHHFTPVGMQDRMVTLFLGLCVAAEIVEDVPRRRGRPPKIESVKKTVKTKPKNDGQATAPKSNELKAPPPPASGLHPFIVGLIQTLPETGTVWPEPKRAEWTNAALAVFNMIYERPRDDDAL